MERFFYWIKKTVNMNWKFCSGFCVTCKYYQVCKKDEVLK